MSAQLLTITQRLQSLGNISFHSPNYRKTALKYHTPVGAMSSEGLVNNAPAAPLCVWGPGPAAEGRIQRNPG